MAADRRLRLVVVYPATVTLPFGGASGTVATRWARFDQLRRPAYRFAVKVRMYPAL